jgi:hypothetical protein
VLAAIFAAAVPAWGGWLIARNCGKTGYAPFPAQQLPPWAAASKYASG